MAAKDITDKHVVEAYRDSIAFREVNRMEDWLWPADILAERTGQPYKVCLAAINRAVDRDYIDYGVSLRCGFVTEKGEKLLK